MAVQSDPGCAVSFAVGAHVCCGWGRLIMSPFSPCSKSVSVILVAVGASKMNCRAPGASVRSSLFKVFWGDLCELEICLDCVLVSLLWPLAVSLATCKSSK